MSDDDATVQIPFMEMLCCTSCRGELSFEEGALRCLGCGEAVPLDGNVPLFSADYIQTQGSEASREKQNRTIVGGYMPVLKRVYKRLTPPSFQALQRGEDKTQTYMNQVRAEVEDPLIVDIGAGSKRWQDVMSVDVYNYPGIDYCAFADKLPFKTGSVDMLVSSSAIEHFKSMRGVYDEFSRVVKPDGLIVISAPFVYPFHAEPSDYHRWSANGLVDDFSEFEVIESGGYVGPHAAIHAVLSSYFSWMLSFGNHAVYMALNLVFGWLFFPLQIAERLRGQYRPATPIDAIAFIIGRKKRRDG